MKYHIHANHGDRPFIELAQANGKVLIEYEMPNGTSCLKAIPRTDYKDHLEGCQGLFAWKYDSVSYGNIPQYWVDAMVENHTERDMIFYPQQLKQGQLDDYLDKFNKQVAKSFDKLEKQGRYGE